MGIVKRRECWERVGRDEPWEQKDFGRVLVREFRDTDEALESATKAGEDTPLRSRRLDPWGIGESRQFFMRSPMGGPWGVQPQ
jgi:hypothetical protein